MERGHLVWRTILKKEEFSIQFTFSALQARKKIYSVIFSPVGFMDTKNDEHYFLEHNWLFFSFHLLVPIVLVGVVILDKDFDKTAPTLDTDWLELSGLKSGAVISTHGHMPEKDEMGLIKIHLVIAVGWGGHRWEITAGT